MSLFNGVISIKSYVVFVIAILAILFVGYAIGRIKIKGVSLGDAGVFIIALLFGALLYEPFVNILVVKGNDGNVANFAKEALKIVEQLGLLFFVTAVGFIAGPKFFSNLKKNFKSYVLLGLVIIIAGGLSAVACIYLGKVVGYGSCGEDAKAFTAMIVGLLSGSLTSTPAFSAAKDTVMPQYEDFVSVGHGIAYIFGVIGVVLFVQLVPKFMKANMAVEREKLESVGVGVEKKVPANLFSLDHYGIAVFSLVAVLGTFLGSVKIPLSSQGLSGTCFSLTSTGGCLLVSLVFGHFAHFGKLNVTPDTSALKLFRELGLVLFLVGAGIPGGAEFVEYFDVMYFVYGAIMTIVPMFVGFFFAKYVLKLNLLNNLGSITGGMTSTPALGTLINVAGTESVAAAYAATYPIALIVVVLVSQFLIILF